MTITLELTVIRTIMLLLHPMAPSTVATEKKLFTGIFQQGHYSNHLNQDDQGSPHMIGTAGDELWRTGQWSFTIQGKSGDPIKLKGYWSAINVRQGDAWKIQMQTFNVNLAPAVSAQTK
jgi:ketosteroid isomerase-like protein